MRGKLVRLALGLVILALAMGAVQKPAEAVVCPAYRCCDSLCALVHRCGLVGGSCVCSQLCWPGPGGGSD